MDGTIWLSLSLPTCTSEETMHNYKVRCPQISAFRESHSIRVLIIDFKQQPFSPAFSPCRYKFDQQVANYQELRAICELHTYGKLNDFPLVTMEDFNNYFVLWLLSIATLQVLHLSESYGMDGLTKRIMQRCGQFIQHDLSGLTNHASIIYLDIGPVFSRNEGERERESKCRMWCVWKQNWSCGEGSR
jgi:hypothetical protein